jgi:hypothetical protein
MCYVEKDGFEELIDRAIRMGRYDLIGKVIEARDQAERESNEAIIKREMKAEDKRYILIKFDVKSFCDGCPYGDDCPTKYTYEAFKCFVGLPNCDYVDEYFEEYRGDKNEGHKDED